MNTKEDLLNVDLSKQKVALFIGSEENGLSKEIQNKLDVIVKINNSRNNRKREEIKIIIDNRRSQISKKVQGNLNSNKHKQ